MAAQSLKNSISKFGVLLLMIVLSSPIFAQPPLPKKEGVALGSAGFNELLAKQIQPGVLTTEQLVDGSFQLNNPVQTVQAHVTANGTTFISGSKEKNKGGSFSLNLAQWGRDGALQIVDSSSLYVKDDVAYHTYANGIAEKFSNTGSGIRQDFIIAVKPEGNGALQVQLNVEGATLNSKDDGFTVALDNSQRVLTYDRLTVTDVNGKVIPAHMQLKNNNQIIIAVDDSNAQYPLMIDPTVGDANWISMGGMPGANGAVNVVLYSGSDMYIGGSFISGVDNVVVNNIAKWNGTSWSALGAGTSAAILALAVDGSGNLYAGGNFTTAGGVAINRIAKWDGSTWSSLGTGINNAVNALAVDGSGNLYAGGIFSSAGGVANTAYIAKWNGSVWSAVSGGTFNNAVRALTYSGGNLYAGGDFTSAGGVAANRIAKWNGTSWSALGTGVSSSGASVYSVAVTGTTVYVGGLFTAPATNIARWNGSAWSALGTGTNNTVNSLVIDGSANLYAAGNFTLAGGVANTVYLAKWNGSAWSALGTGASNAVSSLAIDGGDNLYGGGSFTSVNGVAAFRIAKWDGALWSALGTGMNNSVTALVFDASGNMYAGGLFTTIGSRIAKWNGSSWSSLGTGMNNGVYALAFDSIGNLYAGGSFTSASGVANTAYIAKWNGSAWSALGTGMNATVFALAFDNSGNLYAGGNFSTAGGVTASRIAKWNGSVWSALGTGATNSVNTIVPDNSGNVYMGGFFTTAGGVTVNRIAKWNGSAWSALGAGVDSTVRAIVRDSSGNVYVGGDFTQASGVANTAYIAKWNGVTWSALGTGMNSYVRTLLIDNNNLYAGGDFTLAGGITNTKYIASWDGSTWAALGTGLDSNANTLAFDNKGDMYVGGGFTMAGGKVSAYMAKLLLVDTDGDGIYDDVDTDDDDDGFLDESDNCSLIENVSQLNTDGDAQGDVCDTDDDNDGVIDSLDSYPLDPTRAGDADGDGLDFMVDNCPSNFNPDQLNTDGDAQGDVCDSDDDNDGTTDINDKYPLNIAVSSDADLDGFPDAWNPTCDAMCQANSGVMLDNCPSTENIDQLNTDGDTQGDVCDSDDDNDTVLDVSDNCQINSNTDQFNTDGDTQGDVCDADPLHTELATKVASGIYHTCVLTDAVTVKCWGQNAYGELGDNSVTQRITPVDVVGLNSSITAIAAGWGHTCALTSAGGVKCWGRNEFGELGNNSTTNRLTPVDAGGLSSDVMAITTGYYHSCALTNAGAVKCWGNNTQRQLGDNSTTNRLAPVDVVGLGSGVMSIAAGQMHTCALTSAGGVKCWGYNANGQLGDNTTTSRLTPVDVVGLSSGVMAITMGNSHTCALTVAGAVKCWGNNNFGQLGDNSTTERLTPVDAVGLSSGVMAITASGNHACALINGGSVKCWGSNNYGQLGDDSIIQRNTPVDVVGLGNGVATIAAGLDHTCAVTNMGAVKCWGRNVYGGLGDNSTTNRYTPVFVSGLSGDSDADGIADAVDVYPYDTDNDGIDNIIDTDDDGDGMPDSWEILYGLNPLVNDASGDADGDGVTNFQEYTNGSNPTTVVTVKNDYTDNSIAGWIWKGQSNGYETVSQIWQLTFPLVSPNYGVPNRFYPPPFPDQANWELLTSGDFNRDGDADILWRHLTLATWKVWQMQNGTRIAQNAPADFDLAHEWQVIGAGDTDKDGDDDVILNNTATGEVLIWQMQDHAIAATHNVGSKAGYTLNRIGDFNKDGDVDLLFRENSTDVLVTWELEASAFVTERALANTGTGYNPVCAGDFDNDGDDDIMLVNSSTTQEKWFAMENYVRTQQFGSSNTGFVFKGCGDYDGDGDADSLWQRSSDDANRVVLQQNWGIIKQTVYTNAFGGVNPGAAGYGFVYRGNSN